MISELAQEIGHRLEGGVRFKVAACVGCLLY